MLEDKESSVRLYFASHFTTQAKSWVTRETLYLEGFKCDLSSFLLYYIYPHYPQNYKEAIQKKSLEKFLQHTHLLEKELLILKRELLILKWEFICSLFPFPFPFPSPIVIPWEEIYTQTQPTPIQSIESVLKLGKHLGFAKKSRWGLANAIERYCRIRITSEDKTLKSSLVAGAWKNSSILGKLGLEGLFDVHVLQLIH